MRSTPGQWPESPFGSTVDPRWFYSSPTHEEALARLEFLAEQHRRLGLLIGPAGTGKTMVLSVFARRRRRRGEQVAYIEVPGLEPADILWELNEQLRLSPRTGMGLAEHWGRLRDHLRENRYQGVRTLLLFDDVDRAEPDAEIVLERFARLDPVPQSHLTMVLAVRPVRHGAGWDRLAELAELTIHLQRLERSESDGYVTHRLQRGGFPETIFAAEALQRLYALSGGIPRHLNRLCDLSLLAGTAQELPVIGPDVVESVHAELIGPATEPFDRPSTLSEAEPTTESDRDAT